MNFFKRFKRAIGIWMHYYVRPNPSDFGYFGKDTQIGVPTDLKNPKNVFLHDLVRIGPRSTFIAVGNSKFVMKRGCLSAEGLTVMTSNHLFILLLIMMNEPFITAGVLWWGIPFVCHCPWNHFCKDL